MHITKIELENIKSHVHETYNFERGTTAITGANGAGKTTIIEAVAWTLFDLLDYKKDDFARRGSKTKGIARVTFLSGLDEREYTVYRDTATGYYIYDPQLKARIAEKKDEVTRFLRQHLGVEPGTDLEALFRRAIGVPQGTFTAIFLESGAERKRAFDKLLKVEEYRQGAEKLLQTANYVKNKIVGVREKIARAEGELARLEIIETENKSLAVQIDTLAAEFEKLNAEVVEKRESVKASDEIEKKISELKNALDRSQSELIAAEIVGRQKEIERDQASVAKENIKRVEADHQTHIIALAALKKLDGERSDRDELRRAQTKIENAIVSLQAERKNFTDNLHKAAQAKEKITKLEPQAAEETELKKQLEVLRNESADARAAEKQIAVYEGKLGNLRVRLGDINAKIKETEAKSEGVEKAEDLQRRETMLTGEIAKLRAAAELDEQFQKDILEGLMKNQFCPIFSQKCLNLETGKASPSSLVAKQNESKTQLLQLETEQTEISGKLAAAREAEKVSAALPTLFQLKSEVTEEGKRLREEQNGWKTRAENFEGIKTKISETETKLKVLDEPAARIKALRIEAESEITLREKISETEKQLEQSETERKSFGDKLTRFAALDADWNRFSGDRDRTLAAHREFLVNEAAAQTLEQRETELQAAIERTKRLKAEMEKSQSEYETANASYDRERHLSEKAALLEAEKRLSEIRATLEIAKKRQSDLEREINRLLEIRQSMQTEFVEKERLEKIGEATDFIRETLKEAAPRVARNYVHHVSLEANQMFREISGNAERTLKWTEDYGIVLEENGFDRPFINLSGGEQMAAALSVRLALLKQLSDVRLAFFDEPTTNMDSARRERLAEQISHITERQTFDQLFVISHDDTFEGYVDNVVSIGGNEAQ